jgi:uncharacterized protein YjgD (DUF1641 family)
MQSFILVSSNSSFIEQEINNLKNRLQVSKFNIHDFPGQPSISIDEIRQVINLLSEKPFGGGSRIVILRNFHQTKTEAANALLKVLEEPPPTTYFILTSANTDTLLPTILSRCQVIAEKNTDSEFDKSAIDSTVKLLEKILKSSPGERILMAQEKAKSKDDSIRFLKLLRVTLIYILHNRNGNLLLELPDSSIADCIKKINNAIKYLDGNVNYKATMDILLIGFPSN